MLTDHVFSPSYASEADDLVEDLYLPAMREAVSYDRIAGFFSSSVLVVAWPALRRFVAAAGRIRLLCSPRLSEHDAQGLVSGYRAREETALAEQLRHELDMLLAEPALRDEARALTALIASGVIDVRLATVAEETEAGNRRMFHDKVGLFTDAAGNQVGFRGTFNETFSGLLGNVESVDVWTSWEDGKDLVRLADASKRFERLWNGEAPGVRVIRLPEATLEYIHELAKQIDQDGLLRELEVGSAKSLPTEDPWVIADRTLRAHQRRAVQAWRDNDGHGLLAHATASGKTTTGLFCIREALGQGLRPIVIVPSALLLDQWRSEIRELLGYRVLTCGGGDDKWRRGLVTAVLEDTGIDRVVVAVAATASSPEFLAQTRRFSASAFLVADEVHRLGSPQYRTVLESIPAAARLGLSATPERAGDAEGTRVILNYFGGIIDTYGIKEALADGMLAPYEYAVEFVHLNVDEQDRFEEFTRKIRRQAAIARGDAASEAASDRLKRLLIDRARVVKNAAAKPAKAADVLSRMYQQGDRWLVYCDNRAQVDIARASLRRAGIESWEYFRGMTGDADNTLRAFDSNGGVVVSIRCLDEGVDIPAADHALILASSRNPREHIQRRGRVLRRAEFKTVATLVDVLTLPQTLDSEDATVGTVVGEVARAMEFAELSLTMTAKVRVREKWIEMGLPLSELPQMQHAGVEDDSLEEEPE